MGPIQLVTMLGARHLGSLLAAGLAAVLIGSNVFAGNTASEAVSSYGDSDQKVDSFLTADHLETFHKDGIVIVDSLLTETELSRKVQSCSLEGQGMVIGDSLSSPLSLGMSRMT